MKRKVKRPTIFETKYGFTISPDVKDTEVPRELLELAEGILKNVKNLPEQIRKLKEEENG